MRQNALERPRKCSDIVPRTFLAHFCHFLELQILGNFENFCKNAILRPSHSQHMLCKNGDLTHIWNRFKIPIRCVSNRHFCTTYVFRREASNRIFGPLRGYTGKIKILKSAIFPHDFGLKFFEKFSKIFEKKCDFSTDSRRSKISKMVSRKAKTRFLSALWARIGITEPALYPMTNYWTQNAAFQKSLSHAPKNVGM